MQQKSYQNNAEFYRMMQKVKEEAKNESSKIIKEDDAEKLLKIKEQIYKVQKDSQKEFLEEKEKADKAKIEINEEQRKYLEQLRKYNK